MSYSATLDFDSIFGSARTCPGCGSADVDIADGAPDAEFRCRGCGSEWHLTHSSPGYEVSATPQRRLG